MRHRIKSLTGVLIEVETAWTLDVRYRVQVEDWSPQHSYSLHLHLMQDDSPVSDVDGRPIELVLPLEDPYDTDRHDSDFKGTFRARISKSDMVDPEKMQLKLFGTLLDPAGRIVARGWDYRIWIRELDDDYSTEELKDTDRSLVVILPGILGADSDQRRIVDILEGNRGHSGIQVAGQIWDWTEHASILRLGLRDRTRVNVETEEVARSFAEKVHAWKKKLARVSIYCVALVVRRLPCCR